MVGQLKFLSGAWGSAEWGRLYGLPVLRSQADPEGVWGQLRLRRAGHRLRQGGAVRVLTPKGFSDWTLLGKLGLSPVDPSPFVRTQGAPLALEALRRQGARPERAVVALRGQRADRDMVRAAEALCPQVRRLVIDAPQGGAKLADYLRWEFGIPILPPEEGGAVALCFAPNCPCREEHTLSLFGAEPELDGLGLTVPELEGEDRTDLPLLTALWEGGKLEEQEVKIT